jgi:hypothetical protein
MELIRAAVRPAISPAFRKGNTEVFIIVFFVENRNRKKIALHERE